ncbi:FumA C-terminus/TtdB family hydratase beta subunit [Candidatus Neptunichlamydia sp. REUL1]|uniref:FumA C-terminus/TtdB family hydratase beta subunit n=1 Tax=Candidatus Neptunichlamydia sp. REUL1 TaxID=3064277 RepID=UPI00292E487C|nr:FumA C-terminus/TtdB family hydratase beta subunit [Candidatus Neptunochlamydia sp. REUL1]
MKRISVELPLSEQTIQSLKVGDYVHLSGMIFTGRDVAHKRFIETIEKGEPLPFAPQGQIIYYARLTPKKPGYPIGSAGPTTSTRMDPYTSLLLERGLKGMIGKGHRSTEVRNAIQKYQAVYFSAIEGTAALLCKRILESEVIAYADLGAEAVFRLKLKDFPEIVVNDTT